MKNRCILRECFEQNYHHHYDWFKSWRYSNIGVIWHHKLIIIKLICIQHMLKYCINYLISSYTTFRYYGYLPSSLYFCIHWNHPYCIQLLFPWPFCLYSAEVCGREVTLQEVGEALGPSLTHERPREREVGTQFLAGVLGKLPPAYLNPTEASFMTAFLVDRLRDHHTVQPAVFLSCLALVSHGNGKV